MTTGIPGAAGKLLRLVDSIHIVARQGIGQVHCFAEKPFIEKPGTACILAGRRCCHEFFDRTGANGPEQGFQDEQVHAFILQGKCQVACKARLWRVALRVDSPVWHFHHSVVRAKS